MVAVIVKSYPPKWLRELRLYRTPQQLVHPPAVREVPIQWRPLLFANTKKQRYRVVRLEVEAQEPWELSKVAKD